MNVYEAIRSRRSIRSFSDKKIEEDKLRKVLDAGRLAPSAGNMQEWKFVVVRDKETKEKLGTAANNQRFIAKADVIIVGCATIVDQIMSCRQYTYPIDLAIAMDHMTLQAVEEGLGTCWIGAFKEGEVKKILGIPPEIRVVELMPLGYPLYVPELRSRKKFDEIVVYDQWV